MQLSLKTDFSPGYLTPISPCKESCAALWNRIQTLLKTASDENHLGPTPLAYLNEIEILVDELCKMHSDRTLIDLLKLLADTTFFHTKPLFLKALHTLSELRPKIRSYFTGEDPIITQAGMTKLIDFFETSYGFPKEILSCQNVSDLPSLLTEIFTSSDEFIMKGFIILNPPEDPHVTPIFIIKNFENMNILISDSKGHTISSEKKVFDMCEAMKKIISVFRARDEDFERIKIYSYQPRRQTRDDVSCPVFALLDLKNLVERHLSTDETIFDFFTRYADPRFIMHEIMDDSDLPLYEISLLPPEMMKVTQSYTALDRYYSHSPELSTSPTPFFMRRSPTGDPYLSPQDTTVLIKTASASKCFPPEEGGHPINKYVEKKRWQFLCNLISY